MIKDEHLIPIYKTSQKVVRQVINIKTFTNKKQKHHI